MTSRLNDMEDIASLVKRQIHMVYYGVKINLQSIAIITDYYFGVSSFFSVNTKLIDFRVIHYLAYSILS
jgi:hypothetical protein